jgi:hypothetical protein
MTEVPDEMDFPVCCFCDKKYGSDACQQCPAHDGSASASEEEEEDDWDDEDLDDDEDDWW